MSAYQLYYIKHAILPSSKKYLIKGCRIMKLERKQILAINGLAQADKAGELSDEKIGAYLERLSHFIDEYPQIEAELKRAIYLDCTDTIRAALAGLQKHLRSIYADKLADECEKVAKEVGKTEPEKLEANLLNYIAAVATLSVDVQMEVYRAEQDPASIPPKTRKLALAGTSQRQQTILAVDDISLTLNILKTTLQSDGYAFYGVTSGPAALDFVKKITPDLFILDIEMPKMNGFELAQKLREANQYAPIIFLTGNSMREHLQKAVKAGAVDFIVKPIIATDIAAKVKKAINAQ